MLVVGQRLAERLALLDVLDGALERDAACRRPPCRRRSGARSGTGPSAAGSPGRSRRSCWPPAPARRRTTARRCRSTGCPSLSSLRLTEKPGDVGRHDDLAHAAVAALVGRAGQQAQPVGLRAVGDVELGAVDDPLVAVAHGAGADAGHVAAGVGLGHRDGGHHLAADGRRQVPLLQLVASRSGAATAWPCRSAR